MNKKEYQKEWYKNNRKKVLKQQKEYKNKHPFKYWSKKTIYDHKRKGYKIYFNLEQLFEMAKFTSYCSICGRKLNWNYGDKKKFQINSPSLDRKDNSNILTLDNVWIICNRCNRVKGSMLLKEFLKYCKRVVKQNE